MSWSGVQKLCGRYYAAHRPLYFLHISDIPVNLWAAFTRNSLWSLIIELPMIKHSHLSLTARRKLNLPSTYICTRTATRCQSKVTFTDSGMQKFYAVSYLTLCSKYQTLIIIIWSRLQSLWMIFIIVDHHQVHSLLCKLIQRHKSSYKSTRTILACSDAD